MKDLAAIFTAAGCDSVKTYIQSGNVVFRADDQTAARIPSSIATAIERQFGFDIAVLTLTHSDLQQIVQANPFPHTDAVHVAFLMPDADTKPLLAVDQAAYTPDEFRVTGRAVYLYLPNGVGRSKLALTVDAKLCRRCTMRNWRTIVALYDLQ